MYNAATATTATDAFGYNDDNEMTSQNLDGTAYTVTHDAWGRTTKVDEPGTDDTEFAYRYGGKLYQRKYAGAVVQTYQTAGDGKRHTRTAGGDTREYFWAGYTVVNEHTHHCVDEDRRTYVGRTLAHKDHTGGAWTHYFQDHLGSARRLRDGSGASIATYEFTPYGNDYNHTGAPTATTHQFACLARDPAWGADYAPFRWYNPTTARWLTRDPMGMVDGPNVYGYVGGNPVMGTDPLGLAGKQGEWDIVIIDPEQIEIQYTPSDAAKEACDSMEVKQLASTDKYYTLFDKILWHADDVKFFWDSINEKFIGTDNPGISPVFGMCLGGMQRFINIALCLVTITDPCGEETQKWFALSWFTWSVETKSDCTRQVKAGDQITTLPRTTDGDW